jgi:hypothetical protein
MKTVFVNSLKIKNIFFRKKLKGILYDNTQNVCAWNLKKNMYTPYINKNIYIYIYFIKQVIRLQKLFKI